MALESDGGGGAKRRRLDEQGRHRTQVAAGPESAPAVRLSELPEDLRRRILTRLPLKDAIRSGVLAQGWRDLWKSRWAEPTSCRDIHLLPADNPRKLLASLESVPRRHLDRFSFVSDSEMLRPAQLKRFLAYAAECRVEDLHVEVRRRMPGLSLTFDFPLSSPLLAHLSLRNINISDMYYKDARPFYALEAIHLRSVGITELALRKMMALCPGLHTLDLRWCNCENMLCGAKAFIPPAGDNLKSITVAKCHGDIRLDDLALPSLRSFRYSGEFDVFPFFLPEDAALNDLYVCCTKPISIYPYLMSLELRSWNRALPVDLSGRTVLTVCSSALKMASFQCTQMANLQSMKELQLLMFEMKMDNLADIYLFLKSCHCPNLETLFVQLPATCDVPLEDFIEEVRVKLPEDSLVNLRMVKVMNFNWRRFEVRLVCFLLRKATSLHKLLLVSPNVAPQHVHDVQAADLRYLNEALASGRVIVSKSDYSTTQPFHSEVFMEV